MKKYLLTAATFVFLLCSCRVIKPDSPTTTPIPDTPPVELKQSFATIPLELNLTNLFNEANSSLDRTFSRSDNPCEGVRYNVNSRRDDLLFGLTGTNLGVKTKLFYGARAEYCAKCAFKRCIVPKVSASCGVDGEGERIIRIGINSNIKLLPTYKLNTVTTLTEFEPENRCKVFIINFDITDRIIEKAKPKFVELLGKLDSKIGELTFRDKVENIWNKIQNPFAINEIGFLKINPQMLGLSEFRGENNKLFTKIELKAFPSISSDATPSMNPLPDLSIPQTQDAFDIQFDLSMNIDSLSKILTNRLLNNPIKIGKKIFIITNCRINSIGNNKISTKIDFEGSRKGYIYLVGTPTIDSLTQVFSFPDLNFDAKTNSLLLNIAKWILNNKITQVLREKSRFNLTERLLKVQNDITVKLNEPLGDNVVPRGELTELKVNSLFPLKDKILLRTDLKGKLSLTITE
jgi:hypothetical protein